MTGNMKFCIYCGQRIPLESSFCEYCGKKLSPNSSDEINFDLIDTTSEQAEADKKAKTETEKKAKADAEKKAEAEAEFQEKLESELKDEKDSKDLENLIDVNEQSKKKSSSKNDYPNSKKPKIQISIKKISLFVSFGLICLSIVFIWNFNDAQAQAQAQAQAHAKAIAESIAHAQAITEAIADARAQTDKIQAKAKSDADAKAKSDADAKAKADADAKAKSDADAKAKSDADAKAKSDADAKVKADADAKAKADADAKAKADADAKAKADADAKTAADKAKPDPEYSKYERLKNDSINSVEIDMTIRIKDNDNKLKTNTLPYKDLQTMSFLAFQKYDFVNFYGYLFNIQKREQHNKGEFYNSIGYLFINKIPEIFVTTRGIALDYFYTASDLDSKSAYYNLAKMYKCGMYVKEIDEYYSDWLFDRYKYSNSSPKPIPNCSDTKWMIHVNGKELLADIFSDSYKAMRKAEADDIAKAKAEADAIAKAKADAIAKAKADADSLLKNNKNPTLLQYKSAPHLYPDYVIGCDNNPRLKPKLPETKEEYYRNISEWRGVVITNLGKPICGG